MRTGENGRDILKDEKTAGKKAAKNIRQALRSVISAQIGKKSKTTGTMLNGLSVKAKMRYGQLDNITIGATNVTFIQHYGFEKSASNKARFTLKPRNYFTEAFNKTKALEVLADELGDIRAEEITSKIRL